MAQVPEELKARLLERLRAAFPGVRAVYAHGSFIRGSVRADSDLDLALLLPHGDRPKARDRLTLLSDLEEIAGRRVDLGLLDPARSIVFCKEVLANGARWATFDERAVAEFEMYALAAYADYRETMAPVVAAYAIEAHD